MIATAGSEEKARRLRALGADATIDHGATPEWHERVRELTGGLGVDHHVVEVTGRLEAAIRASAIEGEIAFVGLLADDEGLPPIDAKLLWMSGADVRTLAVGSRSQFEAMNATIEARRLQPVIDRVFGFDEAPDAYRYYESAKPFGKIVIAHA